MPGFFTPGTPLYTEEGGEPLKGKRDIDGAKKLLAEAGYPASPSPAWSRRTSRSLKAMGEVTADLLKKIGMNVDFVATDWGTVGQRRASRTPPGQGGWGMFHTWHAGADCANPASYIAVRANGEKAWFGWPDSPEVEKEVAAWFSAKDLDEEKAAIAPAQQGGHGARRLRTDRILLRLSGLAQQCQRRRQGPAAVLLGRDEGLTASAGSGCSLTSSDASWRRSL